MVVLQVIWIVLLVTFNYWVVIGPYGVEQFDRNIWFTKQTNKTDTYCFRGALANDVNYRLIREGMTKENIIEMLGKPDENEINHIEYNLGYCSPLDYNGLIVYFDNSGKVRDAHNVQH